MSENDALLIPQLREKALVVRRHIIRMTTKAGSGHPTSSLSAVELVVALYFGGILRYRAQEPSWPQRDRFILSKGHAAPLLYAVLAEAGYFPVEQLDTLRQIGSPLEGHPNMRRLPGVEASTGSLGQGLSIGLGHALACRLNEYDSRVYVLLGDGEVNEGQVWEAVMAAVKYRVDNLVAIVDHNGYQQTGPTREVLDLDPLPPKFASFGWHAEEIDGHNWSAVLRALRSASQRRGQPSVIVARTIKGYPIHNLLAEQNYHGRALTPADAEKALALLAG
ncbi:MAG: transketolase [Gemmatales bacterium]|nr:transketolase [Gemmatales bacterium]MCS7160648.1 transketolase [Gemmatales bacterium]MDW8175849.1 transketolase [Gemmatales bacterium]MDW8222633.1 transketolase [Gemmatales bacterium]